MDIHPRAPVVKDATLLLRAVRDNVVTLEDPVLANDGEAVRDPALGKLAHILGGERIAGIGDPLPRVGIEGVVHALDSIRGLSDASIDGEEAAFPIGEIDPAVAVEVADLGAGVDTQGDYFELLRGAEPEDGELVRPQLVLMKHQDVLSAIPVEICGEQLVGDRVEGNIGAVQTDLDEGIHAVLLLSSPGVGADPDTSVPSDDPIPQPVAVHVAEEAGFIGHRRWHRDRLQEAVG
ncbi:MAG: hypothetical protein ABI193_27225, partial [Minicystis sp.]